MFYSLLLQTQSLCSKGCKIQLPKSKRTSDFPGVCSYEQDTSELRCYEVPFAHCKIGGILGGKPGAHRRLRITSANFIAAELGLKNLVALTCKSTH